MKMDITDVDSKIPVATDLPIAKVQGLGTAEFVSGVNLYQTTNIRNYKIESNIGSFHRELSTVTPRGYKLYSSVQGQGISRELEN